MNLGRISCVMLCALVAACSSGGEPVADTFPSDPLEVVTSDTGALHVAVRTAPTQPPPRGNCTVEIDVTDAAGAPEDGLAVDATPWMPAMGHGGSTKPDVEARGGGKYLLHNVNLFMPGDWELRLAFSGPVTDHAAPPITVH